MWHSPEKFRMRRWILAWRAAFNGFAGARDPGCVSVLYASAPGRAAQPWVSRGECAITQRFCMNTKKNPGFVVLSLSNRQLFPSALQWGVGDNLFSRRCRESGGIVLKSVWFVWCEIILTPVCTKTALILRAVSAGFSRQLGSSVHRFAWAKQQLNQAPAADFLAFFFLKWHILLSLLPHTHKIHTQKSVIQQKILNIHFFSTVLLDVINILGIQQKPHQPPLTVWICRDFLLCIVLKNNDRNSD